MFMATTLLDPENFKIKSNDWQLQDAMGVINGQRISIKVKVHPEWDVWEYVSGVPSEFIGQQLFTYNAALRETEKIGVSLPEDQSSLEAIISTMPGDNQLQQYKNYLSKAILKFSWCYSSWLHMFDDIWVWSYYRLAEGSRLALGPTTRNVVRRDDSMGYMVSLNK